MDHDKHMMPNMPMREMKREKPGRSMARKSSGGRKVARDSARKMGRR